MKEIAVLIPCYNEEITIEKVVSEFKKELPEAKIYVYDNNSTDRTAEIAKNAGAIVRRENRQGKGNVVRTMFNEIEADIYVMVDGDDTYPADCVQKLIEPIENNKADMTVGDRLSNNAYKNEYERYSHILGNNLVTKTINLLFRCNLKDVMSGYRVFNKTFVKSVRIINNNFEVETEMTIFAINEKLRIKEIPIAYRKRQLGSKSKVKTISDGRKIMATIIKMFKNSKKTKNTS